MRTYRLGARQAPPRSVMQAEAEGDTEDMNRERAETHLRLLAKEELGRATSRPSDGTSGSQPEDEAAFCQRDRNPGRQRFRAGWVHGIT
jgi:hypothetical protein